MTEQQRERYAQIFWECDGPTYTGWPNIGEPVDWAYRDQHPAARDRCFKLADAILTVLAANVECPECKGTGEAAADT